METTMVVMAKHLEVSVDSSHVLLEMEASNFGECLVAFEPIVRKDPVVADPELFLAQVREREETLSTVSEGGVAFPHARTPAVSRLFVAVGRSQRGVLFRQDSPLVHLAFLIGTPPEGITEYLNCVAYLAGRVRNPKTRGLLMDAQTSETFLNIITVTAP